MRNIDKYKTLQRQNIGITRKQGNFQDLQPAQAAMLGVCDKTLKKLAESGEIQRRRVGRRWIFSDRALREWRCSDDGKKNA